MSAKYIVKPAMTLLITAVITVTALSFVYNRTEEPIERQKLRIQETAMREVMPRAAEFKELNIENTGSITAVYECFYSSEALADSVLIGYIVYLSPEGYSGKIDLVVGVSIAEKNISGMRVIRHTETPGFGAKAVREDFYRRFDGAALVPLGVVRHFPEENEIQAITGSTITTKAITNAVNEAIEWSLANYEYIEDYDDYEYRADRIEE
ncbi:MAG: RnfABCDGE type electron transport complex subunit G [Treponema sp.]|nr:RnfABCDGE type electron transport complex subunit G [Treponema sp.]